MVESPLVPSASLKVSEVIARAAAELVQAHAQGAIRSRIDTLTEEANVNGSSDPLADALAVRLLEQLREIHKRCTDALRSD